MLIDGETQRAIHEWFIYRMIDDDLLSNLRLQTSTLGVLRSSKPKIKEEGLFENENEFFEDEKFLNTEVFLFSWKMKNALFLIFGVEWQRIPCFNLWFSASKIEEPFSIFDLQSRRLGRRSDGRQQVRRLLRIWEDSSKTGGGSSNFQLWKMKKSLDLRFSEPEERRILSFSTFSAGGTKRFFSSYSDSPFRPIFTRSF